ncbi:MAG TPA: hypothetical protein VMJ10_31920 [Kofleriaceae bacterium]|nr:hypothetical protein [Kofleriaceae bacterium]
MNDGSSVDQASSSLPVQRVQTAAAPCCGGGTSESQALTSNVTAGDAIVVTIGWFTTAPGSTASIASVTDTLGNAFTLIPSSYALETNVADYGNGNFYSEIAYAKASPPGADTITFTLTGSVTFSLLYVVETTPCTLDAASGGNGSSGAPNAGTVTIAVDGELAVAMTDMDPSTTATGSGLLPGPGWSMQSSGVAEAIFGQEIEEAVPAGPLVGVFDGNGNSGQWMASMAAFESP